MNRPLPSSVKAQSHQDSSESSKGSPEGGGRVESHYTRSPEPPSPNPSNPMMNAESSARASERDAAFHATTGVGCEPHLDSPPSQESSRIDDERKPAAVDGTSRGRVSLPADVLPRRSTWTEDDETILMGHSYRTLLSQDIPDFVRQHATTLTFPQKLMLMLVQMEKVSAKTGKKVTDMPVGWLDNGLAFVIRDQGALVNDWLPIFFKQSKFSSFTRKLYRWRFRQVFTSSTVGSSSSPSSPPPTSPEASPPSFFGHEFFQRDNKALLSQMKSVTAEGRRRREAASVRSSDPYSIASAWQQQHHHPQQLQQQQQDPQQHPDQGKFFPQSYAIPWNAGAPFSFPFPAPSLPQLLAPPPTSAVPAPAASDPWWAPLWSPPPDAAAAAFSAPPAIDPALLQLLLMMAAGAGTSQPGGSISTPHLAPVPGMPAPPPAPPPPPDATVQSLPGPSDGFGHSSSAGELVAALLEQLCSNQAAMATAATTGVAAAASAEPAPNAPYGSPSQPPPSPPPPPPPPPP